LNTSKADNLIKNPIDEPTINVHQKEEVDSDVDSDQSQKTDRFTKNQIQNLTQVKQMMFLRENLQELSLVNCKINDKSFQVMIEDLEQIQTSH
jgi:hypothetical protein